MPDAHLYCDQGCNTLANTARAVGGLNLPNLAQLGLGNIENIAGVKPVISPQGAYGKMNEQSPGKDTTTGHWELAGIILDRSFPVFPDGFPPTFMQQYENRIGRQTLGNKAASGTAIIEELGKEHMATGKPIVYTSADSVFQLAAHEEVIPLPELYRLCEIAREMLTGELAVGRVIARPFVGQPGNFIRTANRQDYSLLPVQPTILDMLVAEGYVVQGVGKIKDIFAGQGITASVRTADNMDGVDKTLTLLQDRDKKPGLIFTNLVEFDQNYGHRNDCRGYAKALEQFDRRLPEILTNISDDDLLIITADHGCDPTTPGTDHSREYVPLLVWSPQIQQGVNLGTRDSFSDVAATIADIFNLPLEVGSSFAPAVFTSQTNCKPKGQ